MTREEVRQVVLRALRDVAPEVELTGLKPQTRLREELDLDSMDFLNFAIALHEALGIEISETDYPRMATLDGCIDYLATRLRI